MRDDAITFLPRRMFVFAREKKTESHPSFPERPPIFFFLLALSFDTSSCLRYISVGIYLLIN